MAEEKTKSVMECERSVITMTLLRLGYLVHSFGNCAMTLLTETGVSVESKKKVGGLGVPAPDRETRRPSSATAAYSYGKALRRPHGRRTDGDRT